MHRALDRVRNVLAPTESSSAQPKNALVLSGGGARSAYQAGVLRYIAEAFPEAAFPVLTGVSAGAINMAHLANHTRGFAEGAEQLAESWAGLELQNVVKLESGFTVVWNLLARSTATPQVDVPNEQVRETHGLLDTTPLWSYLREVLDAPDGVLRGVDTNLASGRVQAVAVMTTNYATGQTVTWVQGDDFDEWERPNRIGVHTTLTVDHIMASTALPLVFPAVRIGSTWYGDGGIRLAAPLAPAVHLGADRILVISNRYHRSRAEADEPVIRGYPPAAQIIGLLMNAIFSDALDQDAFTLERINTLIDELPPRRRHGMRPVELLQLRPSIDLGRLAHDFDERMPPPLRMLTTGLGTTETLSPDWLSVLLFDRAYIDRLLDIGYQDARDQHDDIESFLAP